MSDDLVKVLVVFGVAFGGSLGAVLSTMLPMMYFYLSRIERHIGAIHSIAGQIQVSLDTAAAHDERIKSLEQGYLEDLKRRANASTAPA